MAKGGRPFALSRGNGTISNAIRSVKTTLGKRLPPSNKPKNNISGPESAIYAAYVLMCRTLVERAASAVKMNGDGRIEPHHIEAAFQSIVKGE